MPIFKISGTRLKKLNSLPLDKEKNLQASIEVNLIEVLDLLFLTRSTLLKLLVIARANQALNAMPPASC